MYAVGIVVPTPTDLNLAVMTYESLIANYKRASARLFERRRSAPDGDLAALDERIAANARTIAALEQAVRIAREHLNTLHSQSAHEH